MFKSIKKTFQPNIPNLVEVELNQARMSLLESETALEWAASQVEYNQRRISRLERTHNELLRNLQSGSKTLPNPTSM